MLRGERREAVVPEIAAEFDVEEATVTEDIALISEWLPRLDEFRDIHGITLLRELRANRQQLHQLADRARDDDDLTQERKIREEINRSINFERQLHEGDLKTELSASDKTVDELADSL
ncbi:hypothetical protein [Natrinema versiforme]|uniref:Uncharacterized protein n=1 Tax=Natrinema versiforme TaxID=88724 RepID=A0A4P8WFC2_9EURY|nr:hypothetical protein [Natrinema versiforme]QCS42028.1 hypothetical protein FEJ81_06525 [Natrinema versiforme]